MIALIPSGLMIVAALVIIILNQLKINIGRVWLTAAGFSLINWGFVFSMKWFYPVDFTFVNWFPFSDFFQEVHPFKGISPSNPPSRVTSSF